MVRFREAKLAAAVYVALAIKRRKVKRKCWVKDWLKRRYQLGAYTQLIMELQLEDAQQFRNFTRMSAVEVQSLVNLLGPVIGKQDTAMRQAIPLEERMIVTLRFLATGDSYRSLQYLFCIPTCTFGIIIKEVCRALWDVRMHEYLKFPSTTEEWLKHVETFNKQWNFPHCLGAMDGKHIVMQAPANSGSYYYNYKGTFSTVLLAVVDAEYKFMYVDVGCNGRVSDGGVFNTCSLYEALESGTTKLPPAIPLPGQTQPVPHFFVADDAFAVRHYIMKPYPFKDQPAPNRIFNYRLSRARRIVENVFGIIANRFLVLRKPIIQNPQSTVNIVLAVCVLHNFLMSTQASWSSYLQPRLLDTENTDSHEVQSGTWREEGMPATNLLQLQRRPHPSSQNNTRDEFRAFFMSPQGEITWQYKHT